MKIGFKQFVLTTALAGLVAPVALAQSADNPFQRGRYTPVAERPQPEYNPEPVRAGAFQIWSRLGVAAEYNDNIFAEQNNQDDDTIIRVRPELDVRSNWSSHELNTGVSITHNEYVSNSGETTTDYNAYVGGRLDVQRAFNLRGRLDAAHITEPRYEPGSATSPNPVEYDRMGARVGAAYRSDRLQLEGDLGQTEDDFEGTNNNFRELHRVLRLRPRFLRRVARRCGLRPGPFGRPRLRSADAGQSQPRRHALFGPGRRQLPARGAVRWRDLHWPGAG